MVIEPVGYGAGKARFEERPNLLRVVGAVESRSDAAIRHRLSERAVVGQPWSANEIGVSREAHRLLSPRRRTPGSPSCPIYLKLSGTKVTCGLPVAGCISTSEATP